MHDWWVDNPLFACADARPSWTGPKYAHAPVPRCTGGVFKDGWRALGAMTPERRTSSSENRSRALRSARKEGTQPFRHSGVSEDGISQRGIRQACEHCHLHCGADQGFEEALMLAKGLRPKDCAGQNL